jgi:hypothetical protein
VTLAQELNQRLLDENRDQLLIVILRNRETQLRSQLLAEAAAKTKRRRDSLEMDTTSATATGQLQGEQTAKYHIKDLDGILHYTRVKPDVNKREEELNFLFPDNWQFIMGTDFVFQPAKYIRVLQEQNALPTEDRMEAFKACGLWDQFSTLNIILRPEAFQSFLKGQFEHLTENGFRLSDFSTDGQPPPSTPQPSLTNNTEIIEILRHKELIMITVLSRAFDGIFSDFKEAFQGEAKL